jgi:hypothetical protein
MSRIGSFLGERMPPGATLATTTVGAVSYASGIETIDMLGLTDREIARSSEPIDGLSDSWREIGYNARAVLRRRPDVILFSTGIRPSSAAEKALYLFEDFHRSYYAATLASDPTIDHTQVVFLRRADAPPAVDAPTPFARTGFVDDYVAGHLAASNEEAAELFRRAAQAGPASFFAAREKASRAFGRETRRDPRSSKG